MSATSSAIDEIENGEHTRRQWRAEPDYHTSRAGRARSTQASLSRNLLMR